jgi:preprotein translocase subunit SecE
VADDERDRVENTRSGDSTVDPVDDSTAETGSAAIDGGWSGDDDAPGSDPRDAADDGIDPFALVDGGELEIDDPDALNRATDAVSDTGLDDDGLVEEPTNAELAELTRGSDATAKAGDEPDPNGDGELVGVGAARTSAAKTSEQGKTADPDSTTDKSRAAKARTEKKGRATAKRDDGAPAHKRTGPITFSKESIGELRKVVYPTGPQLLNYFVVVLIFVLFIIAIVSVLDLAFGWAILKIFS